MNNMERKEKRTEIEQRKVQGPECGPQVKQTALLTCPMLSNRFMGLDLIDRVPEKLWTEVYDIVQGAVIKNIPNKEKCKMEKQLSEEALQITEKREVKGKRKNERYTHLNAEFQRIARRAKTAFLSDQCKKRGKQ